ncbi:ATP-binding protein [Pseudonocardia xinjiangensis]|uniref:ATP-binding protein n=1 Tax=Pseudonocardia xinjiangensis TaxID=75289 RepID=UPI003D91D409
MNHGRPVSRRQESAYRTLLTGFTPRMGNFRPAHMRIGSLEDSVLNGHTTRSSTLIQLFGRNDDLTIVRSFLDRAAVSGAALSVVGDAGIGKTMLLRAAVEVASAAGVRVLRAAGVEFEAGIGFSGLNQALLPAFDEFARRLGAAHCDALSVALGLRTGPAPDRMLVANATLALLRSIAADQAVLVVVDDAQWIDRASAAVLGFVARRLDGSRIGFLAAARSDIEGFFEHSGLPEHELQPLDDEAARRLLDHRFPTLPGMVRRRVLAEAQGNPLALVELPTALNFPHCDALRSLPAVLPIGRRLQALFAARIAELAEPTRQLLLLAALDGTGDLHVVHGDGPGAMEHLTAAERAGLVRVDGRGGRLAFRHPLTRSAIVEMSSAAERRRAHLVLAQLWTNRPERRAWHLGEATEKPDEPVARLLQEAAHRSLDRGDATGAISALVRAAHLSPRGADRSRRLAQAAFIGADVTGEMGTASQLLVDAQAAGLDQGGSLYAAATTAYLLVNGDTDIDTAHALLVGAIENRSKGGPADDAELVEALWALSLLCWLGGTPEHWAPYHAAVARLTPSAPALMTLQTRTFLDPVRATASVLDELDVALARLHVEADPATIVRTTRCAVHLDRLGPCRASSWRVLRDGREGGAVMKALVSIMHLCAGSFTAGRWDEITELADEALELCDNQRYRHFLWQFHYYKALVAAVRGDQDANLAWTDEIIRWASPRGARGPLHFVHHARGLAALGRGDFDGAYRHTTAISPAGSFASYAPHALWVMADLVEAALRTGRRDAAAAHVAAMHEANVAGLSPRLALLVGSATALAADDDRATELFEQALALPGIDRWPFDLARTQLAFGEHLRRNRAAAAARDHLIAAMETFRRLGAHPWSRRAENGLRVAGQSRAGRGEGAPDSLTPQEHEIAMLAASGLSNKQIAQQLFLSHRTVGAHLYRAFPKLGISSRAGLRDALVATPDTRRGPDG